MKTNNDLTERTILNSIPHTGLHPSAIWRIRLALRLITIWVFFLLVTGVLAALKPGDILVADGRAADGNGAVIKVDPVTGEQTIISWGQFFNYPEGIVIAPNGDIFVADRNAFGGGGGIIKVDPATGDQSVVSSGGYFEEPMAMAIDSNGDLLVADIFAFASGGIIRVNPLTHEQTRISWDQNFRNPKALAVAANGDIFVTDSDSHLGPGRVIRVDPANGDQTVLDTAASFSFINPFGIVIYANGDLLVADADAFAGRKGGVLRVEPVTGITSIITSGDATPDPIGIALDLNGDILISDIGGNSDLGTKSVIRVNPVTSVLSTISTDGFFIEPAGIAIVPGCKIEFVGFQAPIGGADDSGGSFAAPLRTFKMGSTIPVKFTASCYGDSVTTGVHTLQAIKYSNATTFDTPIEATPQDAATSGNEFRFSGGNWHFNLDTKATSMTKGIWLLVATLSDGSQHWAWIQVK